MDDTSVFGDGLIAKLAETGERIPSAPPLLFSGRSHPGLAEKIAVRLGIHVGEVSLKTFANGELYCRYEESVRGADLFLVQSCSGFGHVNDHLMELLVMVNAAKLASAKRITAVLPWYPYSRQDKKSSAREPITARLVADLLTAAGVERVITMDLHAGQIQGFFSMPVNHMTAIPIFEDYLQKKGLVGEECVVVSPDAGRVKTARRFADRLGCDLALLNKHRPGHDQATVSHLIGEVEGKTAIMTDDIIATGGTLAAGATALLEAGAERVFACATHGLFPDGALDALAASSFEEIVVTDTVPQEGNSSYDKLTVLSISDLLAQTIGRVWSGESLSEFFQNENDVF